MNRMREEARFGHSRGDGSLQHISTRDAHQASAPLSQAVVIDRVVFTSGLVGIDPGSGRLAPDIEAQTRQTLRNLDAVLRAAGSSLANTVKVTVYVRDIALLAAVNSVYTEFFREPWPARSFVQARLANDDLLVEVEAIARASQ